MLQNMWFQGLYYSLYARQALYILYHLSSFCKLYFLVLFPCMCMVGTVVSKQLCSGDLIKKTSGTEEKVKWLRHLILVCRAKSNYWASLGVALRWKQQKNFLCDHVSYIPEKMNIFTFLKFWLLFSNYYYVCFFMFAHFP